MKNRLKKGIVSVIRGLLLFGLLFVAGFDGVGFGPGLFENSIGLGPALRLELV